MAKKSRSSKRRKKTNTKSNVLVCVNCSSVFDGYRPQDKFCSSSCRWSYKQKTLTKERRLKRKENQKKWGEKNWLKRRNYMLMYTYGITPEQYEELLIKQNYCCAVCKRHESEFPRKLAVEHNHQTKEIQGLCCDYCNRQILGRIRNPDLFLAAYQYLSQPGTGWYVPEKRPVRRRRKK